MRHVSFVAGTLVGVWLAVGAASAAAAETTPGPTPASPAPQLPPHAFPPLYTVRIHGVALADDNGTNASPVTAAKVTSMIEELNEIYKIPRIEFVFDPSTDFETIDSTILNQRFGVVGNINSFTDPDLPPPTTSDAYNNARRAHADLHRDKVTIFFAVPLELEYNTAQGKWTLVPAGGGGSSSGLGRWVNWKQNISTSSFAHEIGRYLHTPHPFVGGVSNVTDAANKIKDYVADGHPVADGLLALDGDHPYVLDTPADAAGSIFESVYGVGSKCGPDGTITIPVNFGNGMIHIYTLEPDRGLVMSYFKGCLFEHYFSPDEDVRARESLEMLNRRNLVSIKPSRYPTSLVFKDQESAGSISQVAAARIGRRRLVTATSASSSLKLIVWDVDAAGLITRRGDITVGAVSGPFVVTHGGLAQVLVAYKDAGGGLTVKSYDVSGSGNLTLEDTYEGGGITDVSIIRTDPITFVTPVRLPTGTLRVIAFRIYADGTITRLAHADGGNVTKIESVSYNPASLGDENLIGGVTVFARTDSGNMSVTSWKIDKGDGWAVNQADSDSAGAITDVAAAQMEIDLAASVVRTSTDQQKVIMWSTDYHGAITRKGDYSAGPCTRVAAAAIGTRFLATGCREPGTDGMVMRLFNVSSTGSTVTLRDELAPFGTATELALVPVDNDKVVAVARIAAGSLVLRSFAVEVQVP